MDPRTTFPYLLVETTTCPPQWWWWTGQVVTTINSIDPFRTMNICTNFHCNPSYFSLDPSGRAKSEMQENRWKLWLPTVVSFRLVHSICSIRVNRRNIFNPLLYIKYLVKYLAPSLLHPATAQRFLSVPDADLGLVSCGRTTGWIFFLAGSSKHVEMHGLKSKRFYFMPNVSLMQKVWNPSFSCNVFSLCVHLPAWFYVRTKEA